MSTPRLTASCVTLAGAGSPILAAVVASTGVVAGLCWALHGWFRLSISRFNSVAAKDVLAHTTNHWLAKFIAVGSNTPGADGVARHVQRPVSEWSAMGRIRPRALGRRAGAGAGGWDGCWRAAAG
jgi:hypothetical protein